MKSATIDRAALCNVVLLGLFALGLGLSLLVVQFRTAIVLSEPVVLPGGGLSVSVPVGSGWQSLPDWTYEQDNSFTLVSVFQMNRRPLAEVRWQVQLAEEADSAERLLRRYVERFGGQAGEIRVFEGAVRFAWLYVFPPMGNEELLLAVGVLDQNRVLRLHLRCYAQPLYVEELFEALAASVRVTSSGRREKGTELVHALAEGGYSAWRQALAGPPASYLIRTANGTPIGYARTHAVEADPIDSLESGLDFRMVLRSPGQAEQIVRRFRAAEDLSEFVWVSTRSQRRGADQTVLRRLGDGTLQIQDVYGRREICHPGPSALPEILLPALVGRVAESGPGDILIDVIAAGGSIVPTAVTKIDPQAASGQMDSARYVVRVDFLHHEDNFEEYYFDSEMRQIGKYEHFPSQASRLWRRATEKELLLHFGNLFDGPAKSVQRHAAGQTVARLSPRRDL